MIDWAIQLHPPCRHLFAIDGVSEVICEGVISIDRWPSWL